MSQKVKVSVLELKSQLKVLQKPTSGNKDVLIERLGWANLPQSFDMFNDSSSSQLDGSNDQESLLKFTEGAVYKRIPKASRLPACLAFTKILQNVINNNDIQAWANLFNFAWCAIGSLPVRQLFRPPSPTECTPGHLGPGIRNPACPQ